MCVLHAMLMLGRHQTVLRMQTARVTSDILASRTRVKHVGRASTRSRQAMCARDALQTSTLHLQVATQGTAPATLGLPDPTEELVLNA